ncbi:Multidrug resistance protein MdtA [Myxococcaceae bacterium]|nr:Multidrug resistance protein MdtA [Myxococcaceae bacterium]
MTSDGRLDALGRGATGHEPARAESAGKASRRARRLRWLLPLAVLALGVVIAGVLVVTRPVADARPPEIVAPLVRVVVASPEPMTLTVEAQGTVQPRTESDLVSEASGRVVWISPSFASGGFFAEGEPLLRIDPRDYEAALERTEAQLLRSESQAELARRTLERRQGLASRDAVSESALDEASHSARAADAAVREARAALAQARLDLERTEIRAPYAGRVRDAKADVGQYVARGTPLGRVYATDYAEIALPIPTSELAFVDLPLQPVAAGASAGPPVRLHATIGGEHHGWTGHIVRTEGAIDPLTRTVQAVVRVDDPFRLADGAASGPPLAPGLFVTAEVAGRQVPSATLLPRVALRDDRSVFVVDAEGKLRRREVELLRLDRDSVVVGEGLRAGERVMVSSLAAATEAMAVRTADGDASSPAPQDGGSVAP